MKFAILFIVASLLDAFRAASAAIPRRVPDPGWPNPPRPGLGAPAQQFAGRSDFAN